MRFVLMLMKIVFLLMRMDYKKIFFKKQPKKRAPEQGLGWYGSKLGEYLEAFFNGDQSPISWIFCVFAEPHGPSKTAAAKALAAVLGSASFHEIVRMDRRMRETTSVGWGIDWREWNIANFFTPQMSEEERRAVCVFASFHPNGFIREQAVHMLKEFDATLPYLILRQNDWVAQVREAASAAAAHRLRNLSEGELLAALPFAEKLRRGCRDCYDDDIDRIFTVLTAPEQVRELANGLESANIRTRRICTDALFGASPPNIELAAARLTCELEPFLRAVIFKKLNAVGYPMEDAAAVFLRDKYAANRMLALRYLLDSHAEGVRGAAERLLLDRSAMVRTAAQHAIEEQTPGFDFRGFYLGCVEQYPAAAICGLGEKGLPEDAAELAGHLKDGRIAVVKAAMGALMRLDRETFGPVIAELLNDARPGVAKTARNLVIKMVMPDYERVREIFAAAAREHTKIMCADILFRAQKWQRLIYMLETAAAGEERIREKSLTAIAVWLANFNRSFLQPSEKQAAKIRELVRSLQGNLPKGTAAEVLFMLPRGG